MDFKNTSIFPEQKKKSIFKTYMIYFICMLLFCGVRIADAVGVFSGLSYVYVDIIFTAVTQIGLMFLLPFALYMLFLRVTPKQVFKTCNFSNKRSS